MNALASALTTSRVRAHASVTALAVFSALVIGRVADFLPSLRLGIILSVVTLLLAMRLPRGPRWAVLKQTEVRLCLALGALAAFTIPFSVWPGLSMGFVVFNFWRVILFFVLVVFCTRALPDVRRLLGGFLGGIFVLEMAMIVNKGTGRVSVTETYDANDVAFVVVCALPLATATFMSERGWRRILAGVVALAVVPVVVLTVSRGGFVAFAVVAVMMVLRLPSRYRAGALILLLSAPIFFSLFASPEYWARISTIWGGGGEGATDYDAGGLQEARWNIWMTGLQLMFTHPLLGVGAGAFEIAEGMTHYGVAAQKWSAAHNSFIQVGAELGIVGLILMLTLIYHALANCRAVARWARRDPSRQPYLSLASALEVGLIAFIVGGFLLSQGYSYMFYFLLAMATALRRVAALDDAEAPATARKVARAAPRWWAVAPPARVRVPPR
jgi:O-antigen ligase